MAQQFVFIDEKELGRSVQQLTKAMRKAHGRYMADEKIRQIFYDNAEPIKQAMSAAAPMRKGVTATKSNVSIGKRKGVRQRSTSIQFKGGNLKKSIDRFKAKDKDDLRIEVGPRTKKVKSGMRSAFYGYFQNFGTRKGVKALNFSDKAYTATKSSVSRGIVSDMEKQVGKMNRELNGAST